MSDAPTTSNDVSPRLREFQAEVDSLKVTGGKANPERNGVIAGAVLMAVGVIVTIVAYAQNTGSTNPGAWADANVLSNLGLALVAVGAVLFLVFGLRRYLRYWLIRLIYEIRGNER
jgi:hypothetical protein